MGDEGVDGPRRAGRHGGVHAGADGEVDQPRPGRSPARRGARRTQRGRHRTSMAPGVGHDGWRAANLAAHRGCSSTVEPLPSKQMVPVRFRSPAPGLTARSARRSRRSRTWASSGSAPYSRLARRWRSRSQHWSSITSMSRSRSASAAGTLLAHGVLLVGERSQPVEDHAVVHRPPRTRPPGPDIVSTCSTVPGRGSGRAGARAAASVDAVRSPRERRPATMSTPTSPPTRPRVTVPAITAMKAAGYADRHDHRLRRHVRPPRRRGRRRHDPRRRLARHGRPGRAAHDPRRPRRDGLPRAHRRAGRARRRSSSATCRSARTRSARSRRSRARSA